MSGFWEWDAGENACAVGDEQQVREAVEAHLKDQPAGTHAELREVRPVLGGDLEVSYEPTGKVLAAVREADGSVSWPLRDVR